MEQHKISSRQKKCRLFKRAGPIINPREPNTWVQAITLNARLSLSRSVNQSGNVVLEDNPANSGLASQGTNVPCCSVLLQTKATDHFA